MPLTISPQGQLIPDTSQPQTAEAEQVMLAPDNQLYKIPVSSLQAAKDKGWKEALPSEIASGQPDDKERAVQEGVAKLQAQGEESRFNDTLTNEFLFGIPDVKEDSQLTPEQRDIKYEVRKRITALHPIEQYTAKGIGFLAPLAVPGVGEAGEAVEGAVRGTELGETGLKLIADSMVKEQAEAGLARKIAGTIANYATQGAIYSAPNAIATAAYGDPEQAAENMLWGIGLSGVLGGGVEVGATALKGVGKGLVKLTDVLGDKLLQKDASGLNAGDYLAKDLLGLSDKTAQKLKDRGQFLDVLDTAQQEGLFQHAGTANYPTKVKEMLQDAGEKIGDLRQKVEDLVQKEPELRKMAPSPVLVGDTLQKELMTRFPEINTATHQSTLKEANHIIDDFMAGGNEQSFAKTREILQNVMKNKGAFERNSPQAKLYEATYQITTALEKEGMAKVFAAGELPQHFPEYLKQLQRYTTGSALAEKINDFKGKTKLSDLNKLFSLGNMGIADLAAFGHPLVAGAQIASKYALKQLLANKFGLLGKGIGFLRNASEDPLLGSYMAKAGQEALQAHLDSLPHILSGSKVLTKTISSFMPGLIGDTTGVSHAQQYDKLTKSITQANADAHTTAQRVGSIASVFPDRQLSNLVVQKKLNTLAYLDSQIPKNPNPPQAFTKDLWQPSAADKHVFMRKVEIVSNPMTVWKHFQQNTMDATDREVLQINYPKIYQAMVQKLASLAADPKVQLKGYQIQQIALFTGLPLDENLNNVAAIQQAIAVPPATQPPTAPSKRGHSNRLTRNDLPSLATPTQQLDYKGTA